LSVSGVLGSLLGFITGSDEDFSNQNKKKETNDVVAKGKN